MLKHKAAHLYFCGFRNIRCGLQESGNCGGKDGKECRFLLPSTILPDIDLLIQELDDL
jgi:hypothetical protein